MDEQLDQIKDPLVCMAEFGRANGVKGYVSLFSYTAIPADIFKYQHLQNKNGDARKIEKVSFKGANQFVVKVDNVFDRDQAARLTREKLFVRRSSLAEITDEDDYYYTDLIGCEAFDLTNTNAFAKVQSVEDYGGGPILSLRNYEDHNITWIPFTRDVVPDVDIKRRRITVCRDLI